MRGLMTKALATAALLALTMGAQAKETVVWWDFLGGGDGVRMKQLLEKFNKENPDIEIQATTLEWGVPFYTKVQTSAAVGEGPDVMTYHLSRLPLGVSTGTLREITPDELKAAGIDAKPTSRRPTGKPPRSTASNMPCPSTSTPVVLYYNKDLLKKPGLLGDDGLPKGLERRRELQRRAEEAQGRTASRYGSRPTPRPATRSGASSIRCSASRTSPS